MLQKLSFVLIIAILLSACGASAPADVAAPESLETASYGQESTVESPAETAPADSGLVETTSRTPAASEAEYFYFTKYSNTITTEDGQTLLYENRCTPSFTSADAQRSEWVGSVLGSIERDFVTVATQLLPALGKHLLLQIEARAHLGVR